MRLLMISGDRSMLSGKKGAFWYTLEAFSKEWERIDVICPKPTTLNSQLSTGPQVYDFFGNVFFHPSPHALWRQPMWIVKRGRQLIDHYHHDVMTVHEYPPFYNGIGAWRLSRKTGVPYVLEVHHIVGYPVAASFAETIGCGLSWLYLPPAIRIAHATRVVNKTTAGTLIAWGAPPGNIRVVPSFYLDRELVASLGDRPPVQYDIVLCGRLVANKGVENLLRAMSKVTRVNLLIVGEGPERARLERLARELNIAPRITFRGWLPSQREVLNALRSAKMLVMNSLSEGGPRVPLEAMACGMPVIVTKVGVMPDVIIDGLNGVFTTGQPDDLAAKIEYLMNNEELCEKMGKEAMQILERFERHKLIAQYARFLQSFAVR